MAQLFKHQQKIIDDDSKSCGLFLGTGTGKTRTALMLSRGSTLVICPKTQKEDGNWEREFKKLGRDAIIDDLKTISKETFRRDHETLPKFDTVIVDEAHTCLGVTPNTRWRNKQEIPRASQLFEALEMYLQRTRPTRFYLATATIMKSPMTVWAAMKLLRPGIDTQHFLQFRNQFHTKLPMPGRDVWVPRSDSATKDELAAIVRSLGYVGRLQDFFDVPDQTFKTDHIELTAKQKVRLKELPLEYPEPIVRLGKRHQVENGVLTGDEFTPTEHFDNNKVDKILEYAEEFPQMVVFAKYIAQIDALRQALHRHAIPYLILTGATSDRGALLAQAKAMPRCVFIAQAHISAGWELPEYPVMIFASRTYSFVDYDQAIGRIQRANNIKKNLYINLVVKGGIDEAVDKSLVNKQDFNERLFVIVDE